MLKGALGLKSITDCVTSWNCDCLQATITVAQGTRSYMAPEVHTIGSVSVKTDVYSFGVLLMEIIRGKSNVNIQHQDEGRRFFPSWAKDKFRRGRYLDAVQDINNSVHLIPQFQKEEAKKMLYIAVSCIQVSAPTKSFIIQNSSNGFLQIVLCFLMLQPNLVT